MVAKRVAGCGFEIVRRLDFRIHRRGVAELEQRAQPYLTGPQRPTQVSGAAGELGDLVAGGKSLVDVGRSPVEYMVHPERGNECTHIVATAGEADRLLAQLDCVLAPIRPF